jgi:uncharacterized protein YbjT (DUF2867 family)
MSAQAASSRAALVAGATGLIGHALTRRLLASASYRWVHVLLRRPEAALPASERLKLHVVDFDRLPASLPQVDDVYCCIGTTRKLAKSESAFRQADFDAVVNTARAAWAAGAKRLAVVSALGADPKSRVFYNRVKGEMQEAIKQIGYSTIVIAQPSLLIGDRKALGQPARSGEAWAQRLLHPLLPLIPPKIRPIEAETVAQSMLDAMLEANPGLRILSSAQMQTAAGATTLRSGPP